MGASTGASVIGGGSAVMEDDLRRGFKAGLAFGVLPLLDTFVVTWVVSTTVSVDSIRGFKSVFGREKEMDICITCKKGTVTHSIQFFHHGTH